MNPGPAEEVAERTETRRHDLDATTRGADSEPGVARPASRLAFPLFVASVVAAALPVAVATTRAIKDGWLPTGDNAIFAIRARDVLTSHHPLIGNWSSASLTAKTQINHPGPLLVDVLAAPARLIDGGAGVAFAVAVINVLSIAGIAVFAYRRGGALLGTVAMAATGAFVWTMGSELLFEPWNPHSVLLPFLLFIVLVWSLCCGDLVALPFAAGVGSFVLQGHLSYALIAPLLGAWGLVGLLLALRRDRPRHSEVWPVRRGRALRAAALAGLVFLACWVQPLIEQFTSDGKGNLTRLADSLRGSSADTIGYGFGTRVVATITALPPWWFRPSMREAFVPGWNAPSAGVTALGLVVLGAVLAGCAWDARRRRDQIAFWAIGTAVVALLAALVTAGQGPITVFGKVTAHTFRWLWPLGAFVFFAVAATLARRFGNSARGAVGSTPFVGGFACVTIVVAALALPYADEGLGPNSKIYAYALPGIHDLDRRMGSLEGEGPLLIDDLFYGPFADPYGAAVIAELQRRDIPFVARAPAIVRQFGDGRRYNGNNAKAALLLRQGEATAEAPAGSRRVARGEGMPAAGVRELEDLKTRISGYIGERGVRLNTRGQEAFNAGKLPTLARSAQDGFDVPALFATRELDVMIREGYLVLDDVWAKRFARYADRQHEWDQKTVALFVGPVSSVTSSRP